MTLSIQLSHSHLPLYSPQGPFISPHTAQIPNPSIKLISFDSIENKIEAIVKKVYGGDGVEFTPAAKKQIINLKDMNCDKLPVCMAKTQYSFSDDPKLLGAPTGFKVTVRNIKVSAGAGFIIALTGEIMTMPGLPKVPAAEKIDVDENGVISGLF